MAWRTLQKAFVDRICGFSASYRFADAQDGMHFRSKWLHKRVIDGSETGATRRRSGSHAVEMSIDAIYATTSSNYHAQRET